MLQKDISFILLPLCIVYIKDVQNLILFRTGNLKGVFFFLPFFVENIKENSVYKRRIAVFSYSIACWIYILNM